MEPLQFDHPRVGTGPGRTFGKLLLQHRPGYQVGLVPSAVGGSPISAWRPGEQFPAGVYPYDNALRRAQAARREGEFAAVLWHQGEADAKKQNRDYQRELRNLILRLRGDLALPALPFLCGGLGDFLAPDYGAEPINDATRAAAAELPQVGYVSSQGLKDKGDQLHFSAASAREFGRRYFEAFLALTSPRNN